nr:cytochrome c oxidase assembly protein [Bacillus sp. ISL-47]
MELWNPYLFIFTIIIFASYAITIKSYETSVKKTFFFSFAIILLYLSLGSPMHLIGDRYLFSAHMLEQALVYLVVPPLLLLGIPKEIGKKADECIGKNKWFSFIRRPLISLLLFNIIFSLYHIPEIFNQIVSNNMLHNFTHVTLAFFAFAMWLPIIPLSQRMNLLSGLQKTGYIFGAGILLTPACALVIFADNPMYIPYAEAPRIFSYQTPQQDQQLGGIIMKVVQEVAFGFMIGHIFFNWAREERLKDAEEIKG